MDGIPIENEYLPFAALAAGGRYFNKMTERGNMRPAGFDIGTTTVCGILIDLESGRTVKTQTRKNDSWIKGEPYERLQDPARIWQLVQAIYQDFLAEGEIAAIGLTGQMHGMVYVDTDGNAVSPLYTWEDERGNRPVTDADKAKGTDSGRNTVDQAPEAAMSRDIAAAEAKTEKFNSQTYAQQLSALTGYPMATGFGLTTHYYNLKNNLIPEQAATFCTIHDYIAMKLTGRKKPLMTASDVASFGCFDVESMHFDAAALKRAGIDASVLPECTEDFALVGTTVDEIPVAAAVGDNQASVIGALRSMEKSLLINIGTSSQVSMCLSLPEAKMRKELQRKLQLAGIELRPVCGDLFLMVGAGLCGGRAYALLEQFFARTVELMTGKAPENQLYEQMNALLKNRGLEDGDLKINTRFCGTRMNPERRGGISGLGEENFTPEEFTFGVLHGMAEELDTFYQEMRKDGAGAPEYLIGSGNAIRSNPYLQKIFEKLFGMELQIPCHREEAAYGAAMAAMTAAGCVDSLEQAQRLIAYEQR